jgi:hypothetical protein
MAELASLVLKVDSSGAIRAVDQFGNSVERAGKQTSGLTNSLGGLVRGLAPYVGAGALLHKFVTETSAAQAAQAQLAAALRSTGGVAGQTTAVLNAHAAALQRVTTFGDDAVNQAQALLLTFTKIGGSTFPAATEAILNVATAMGGDLRGAALQVGKALNDPVLGVTALARSGIQFTESQKQMIKALVDTGRVADAQRLILAELETQFGGSAKAARDTLGGALKGLSNAFGDLFELSREDSAPLIDALGWIEDAITDIGPTAELTWLEFKVSGLKAINEIRMALAKLDMGAGAALMGASRGAFGQGLFSAGAAQAAPIARENANLDAWLAYQRSQFNTRTMGGGSPGGGGRPTSGSGGIDWSTLGAAEDEVQAFIDRFHKMQGEVAETIEARDRAAIDSLNRRYDREGALERERNDELLAIDAAVAAVVEQHHRDSAAALAFRLDKEEDAQRKLASFAGRARAELGKLFSGGALGTLVTGGIGGIFAKLGDSLLHGGKAQREAAEAIRAAAREYKRVTEESRRAFGLSLGDYASFGNGETDLARAIRQQQEQAGSLGENAYGRWASQFDPSNKLHQATLAATPKITGAGDIAPWLAWFETQWADWIAMGESFENSDNPMAHLYKELKALEDALGANVSQVKKLEQAEKAMAVARQISGLTDFRDSLALSAQSPLSPTAQLAEARRQYDLMLALAKGGDDSAIASIPDSARAFLDASRGVFGSGSRYAEAFNRVNTDTTALISSLTADKPIAWNEEMVDINSEQLEVQSQLLAVQEAQVNVAREASARNDARLDLLIERVEENTRSTKLALAALE